MGIRVSEKPFDLEQLFDADEILVSSAGALCLAADKIDGKPVGGRASELIDSLQNKLLRDFTNQTN